MEESMNSEECAAFLHIHENTLMHLISTGEIPAAKIGKCWVFLKGDVVEYLRKQIRTSTAARKALHVVEVELDSSEQRNEHAVTPTLIRRGAPRRKTPPKLPDLPSPELARQLAAA